MDQGVLARSFGKAFDEVALEYDRHRPSYPDVLIDRACEMARIGPGDRVLEIGCGTGQLTRGLLAHGLRVTAIEPGDRLIGLTRDNMREADAIEFVHGRFEDSRPSPGSYRAVFSASAIHWVDPDRGWSKIAEVLAPGGTLALIQYVGLQESCSAPDQAALLSALRKHAPEAAATWPTYRDLDRTVAGVWERRGNISDAWAWLGSHDIARDHAAALFEELQLATVAASVEHTAEELNALLGTLSFWAQLPPDRRAALAEENRALHRRLGRPIRSSTLAVLVTARLKASG